MGQKVHPVGMRLGLQDEGARVNLNQLVASDAYDSVPVDGQLDGMPGHQRRDLGTGGAVGGLERQPPAVVHGVANAASASTTRSSLRTPFVFCQSRRAAWNASSSVKTVTL